MKISIVVPCFNEEEVLDTTAEELLKVIDKLVAEQLCDEGKICFVDDGSKDATWQLIENWTARDKRVSGLKLTRNVGHQNAVIAGLFTATGDAVISIDADLQDDTDAIFEMVREHNQGAEIVFGVRGARDSDTGFKRLTAEGYYRLMQLFGVKLVFNHADFRLLSRRAITALMEFREVNLFLRGMVPLLGFRTSTVYYDRKARTSGVTKYSLSKMLALAWQGITSFSIAPLRFISYMGFIIFVASSGMSAYVILAKFLADQVVPGWASTVLPIYLLGGIQLLSLGVIGEYLGKVYQEVKARPRFLIEKTINLD